MGPTTATALREVGWVRTAVAEDTDPGGAGRCGGGSGDDVTLPRGLEEGCLVRSEHDLRDTIRLKGNKTMAFPTQRPRRLRKNENWRRMVRETSLSVDDIIVPLFVVPGEGVRNPVASMPGVSSALGGRDGEGSRGDPRPGHSGRHPLRRSG